MIGPTIKNNKCSDASRGKYTDSEKKNGYAGVVDRLKLGVMYLEIPSDNVRYSSPHPAKEEIPTLKYWEG